MKSKKLLKSIGIIFAVIVLLIACFYIPVPVTTAIFEKSGYLPPYLVSYTINAIAGLIILAVIIIIIRLISVRLAKQNPVILKEGVYESVMAAAEKIAKGEFDVKFNHAADPRGDVERLSSELTENISRMALELKKTDEMRRAFVANVSHEIQSPLTSIRGFAKALRNEELSGEERQRYLNIIEDESMRLSNLSDNLLKLASLEAETVEFEPVSYRVDSQIVATILSCEPLWRAKGLEVETEFDRVEIKADKELLNQVWLNLIHNGIKFTPEGGKIVLSLREISDRIEIKITDTGIGISDEDKKHIFERFFKADKSRSRSNVGSGLGLTIVKQIIELHNGEIRVESNKPTGAIFTITLPK